MNSFTNIISGEAKLIPKRISKKVKARNSVPLSLSSTFLECSVDEHAQNLKEFIKATKNEI